MGKLSYSTRLFRELTRFARERRVYWIVPLVVVLALAGLLIVAGQSGAPLLYTLF